MNRRETKNAIAVMQAWLDGKGAVQCVGRHREKTWCDCDDGASCSWDWDTFTYRIKPHPVELKAWAVVRSNGSVDNMLFDEDCARNRLAYLIGLGEDARVVALKGLYMEE